MKDLHEKVAAITYGEKQKKWPNQKKGTGKAKSMSTSQ